MRDSVTCTISGVDLRGRGRLELDGHLVHVARALPGDVVRVRARPRRDDDPETLATLERAGESPARRSPGCEAFPRCGGCLWQDVEPAAQRRWKSAMVRRVLSERAGYTLPEDPPITASPDAGHRTRVLLRVHVAGGRLRAGLFARGGRELVALRRCEAAAPAINAALAELHALDVRGLPDHRVRLALATAPAPGSGQREHVRALVTPATKPAAPALALAERMRRAGLFATVDTRAADATPRPCDAQDGATFFAAPGMFEQTNRAANRALRAAVRRRVDALAPARVLDLHCGNGNLSLLLHGARGRVVDGVDTSPQAIAAARLGLASIGAPAERYQLRSAARALAELRAEPARAPELVLLDPPRAGLEPDRHAGESALARLAALRPRHALYVSCDPQSLADDLARLRRAAGYELAGLELFDLFPHTPHVETLAWLRAPGAPGAR